MRFAGLNLALVVAGLMAGPAAAQSLSGVTVGAPISAVQGLAKPDATQRMGAYQVQKWTNSHGDGLSVTADTRTGKVVYVEYDWGGRPDGAPVDETGLNFGKTSLDDLRALFGSNGFNFQGAPGTLKVDDGLVMMNSYDVGKDGGVVTTWVTKISLIKIATHKGPFDPSEIGKLAVLDAVMIGDPAYLTELWTKRMGVDPANKPIAWPAAKP
jgi:hypothetical protein